MTLSILIDNHIAGTSIEDQIRDLEAMALPRTGGEPPTVKLLARGGHIPYQSLRWVIDGLEWGDAIMNASGNRTRQAATLALLEFVADDLIDARSRRSPAQRRRARAAKASGKNRKKNARQKRKPAARNRRSSASGHGRSAGTVTFDGDDLMSVAARELGDARRWREIADLNGIRDPRAVTVGQVLRLP
jgi:nucleoid-associated protein YgaU